VAKRTQARKEAIASGAAHYFTGLPCDNGHVDRRLTSNGQCLSCCREKVARKRQAAKAAKAPQPISARKAAQQAGLIRYTSGKPCVRGHVAERFTINGQCVSCCTEAQALSLKNNPEKHRAATRRWQVNNPEKTRALKRPASANRRASQLKRTLPWLTDADFARIKVKHAEAAWMTKHTGIRHAVDHVYPLQGKLVSGLHVPQNMRVIPMRENSRKNNKLPAVERLPL